MKNNKYIEKLFRKNFEGYKVKPSENVWQGLRRNLMWKNFLHFRMDSFNVYYLGAAIILAGAAWVLIDTTSAPSGTNRSPEVLTEIPDSSENIRREKAFKDPTKEIEENEELIEKKVSESLESPEKKIVLKPSPSSKKTEASISAVITDSIENQMPERIAPEKPQTIEVFPAEAEELLKDTSIENQKTMPNAFFVPSTFEGCVPLQVVFESNSTGAVKYEWNFGDGGTSEAENPVYIFDEPGNYFVSLNVTNNQNQVNTYSEIITVHPKPVANFRIDVDDTQGSAKAAYLYNYSRGATSYKWIFDDGTSSELEEPTKLFEDDNDHIIKLIAINEKGCVDSMILENAFTAKEPEIIFPNAFTPNIDGPSGGYYSSSANANEVFHPYMPKEPVEYTLKIFNKTGNLIFETKDPVIGWDGYYLEELQPQGVYIYKVKARFKNGKQVVKMGDVTLIHEERW